VGKVREDFALVSNAYGPWFVNTTVTCGVPLGFTIEGHGSYVNGEIGSAGLDVARRLGPLGTASVALASSHTAENSGWLTRVAFEHSNRTFDFIVHRRMQSRTFRQVGELAVPDPIEQQTLASVGVKLSRNSNLAVAYATQTTFDREQANVLALNQSMQLGIRTIITHGERIPGSQPEASVTQLHLWFNANTLACSRSKVVCVA